MKEREAHEIAAGMNLEDSFFTMNNIDPNKPVLRVSRRDRNRIIIELQDDEDCDAVIATRVPELVKMATERKDEMVKLQERGEIYANWWNTEIIPSLKILEMSSDDLWKWTQLVMQEMRFWVSVGNMVFNDEIDFMVERRGFDDRQKAALIDGLTRVGLYGGKGDVVPDDLSVEGIFKQCMDAEGEVKNEICVD